MGATTLETLRSSVRGEVIDPNDPGYDEACAAYNAMIDWRLATGDRRPATGDRRPAVVVRPLDARDVAAAVDHARQNDLDLAVRHRVAPDATAFSHREANFATVIAGMWPDPAQNEANVKWVRDYYDATAPHSEEGGYINFMSDDDQTRARANYGSSYDRLAAVKRTYDPGNLFHLNQNIAPA